MRLTRAEYAEAAELAAASGLSISEGLRRYGLASWRRAVHRQNAPQRPTDPSGRPGTPTEGL